MSTVLPNKQLDILQWFKSAHLRPDLAEISQPCEVLALFMAEALPLDPERSAGLRHLLEAKDCFVRAKIAVMNQDKKA